LHDPPADYLLCPKPRAIRAVEAGGPAPVHDLDAGQLIDRLQALGEVVGK